MSLQLIDVFRAGDGTRTRDIKLGSIEGYRTKFGPQSENGRSAKVNSEPKAVRSVQIGDFLEPVEPATEANP